MISSREFCRQSFLAEAAKRFADAAKKPLLGQTVKILVQAVKVKLNLTMFCTQLCTQLNDLDGSSQRSKTNKEKLPLLRHQYAHQQSMD